MGTKFTHSFTAEDHKTFLSLYSKAWIRCREIARRYYNAGLWKEGINYIQDFRIELDKIYILEGAHGMDLEFDIEDFFDDEKLDAAIEKDIKEYLED